MTEAGALAREIGRHIEAPTPGGFERLALRVFAHQYAKNEPYRRFCDGRGATPQTVRAWRDIPAAPAAAFKQFVLTCATEENCRDLFGGRVFHSSGTTGAETSQHFMDHFAVALYQESLRASYRHFVCPDGARPPLAALMPPPAEAPHSSLSFMLGELVADDWGTFYHGGGWQERALRDIAALTQPVVVFGTAFAWVHLFDYMAESDLRLSLRPGSRAVETGGFKGRSREVSRDELYTLFGERLGIAPTHCVAEYGMSEMASQFYDTTLRDHVDGLRREPRKASLPHLLRTRVIDPVTGADAPPGQPGLLAHYDLANLNSVMAIQTEDYGYVHPDGDGFVLLGRAPGAVLRGCSLTAEEAAASARSGASGQGD